MEIEILGFVGLLSGMLLFLVVGDVLVVLIVLGLGLIDWNGNGLNGF